MKNTSILDLYTSMAEARNQPRGLVVVAVFVEVTESTYRKSDFNLIAPHLDKVYLYSLLQFNVPHLGKIRSFHLPTNSDFGLITSDLVRFIIVLLQSI